MRFVMTPKTMVSPRRLLAYGSTNGGPIAKVAELVLDGEYTADDVASFIDAAQRGEAPGKTDLATWRSSKSP